MIDAKGPYFTKDPDEKLDFEINWVDFLGTDTISGVPVWLVPTGITQSTPAPSNTNTTTTIWLTGGTAGAEYELVNRIVTAGGRTADRSLRIRLIPYPTLAANALATIPYVKEFLRKQETEPDNDVDNELLGKLIDSVSNLVEEYCRRSFKTANYVERVSWGRSVNLKQYPVEYVKSIHREVRNGLLISNAASGKDYATGWVSANRKLYLNVSGGASHGLLTVDLSLAANDTLGELVTAIAALGSGWSGSLAAERSGNERSEDLIELTPKMVGSGGLTLEILGNPDSSGFRVDDVAGIIDDLNFLPYCIYDYRLNGSAAWVKYRAGYDTIPAGLQAAAARIVAFFLSEAQRDPSLMSERIGDYSYSRFSGENNAGPKKAIPLNLQSELDLWADVSR